VQNTVLVELGDFSGRDAGIELGMVIAKSKWSVLRKIYGASGYTYLLPRSKYML
jgi:hypothetical protein